MNEDQLLQKQLEKYKIERLMVFIAKLTARVNELEQNVEMLRAGKNNPL